MRMGFVPLINHKDLNSPSNHMARLFHYLHTRHGLKDTTEFFAELFDHLKANNWSESVTSAAENIFPGWVENNQGKSMAKYYLGRE